MTKVETLRPVEVSDFYIKQITNGMKRYFKENIFDEIFKILNDNNVVNSASDIISALKSGRIYYSNGAFRTENAFSNKVATTLEALGAQYRYGAYYIERSFIPLEIENTLALVAAREAAKVAALNKFFLDLPSNLEKLTLDAFIEKAVDKTFKKFEIDLLKTAEEKKIPTISAGFNVSPNVKVSKSEEKKIDDYWKNINKQEDELKKGIDKAKKDKDKDTKANLQDQLKAVRKSSRENAPQLSIDFNNFNLDKQSQKIAQDYVYNMKYWVKKWEVKEIIKMRQDVAKMVSEGARVPTLKKYFQGRWGIAERKAEFLAVNESHLAGSVISATRYQGMGFTHFQWDRSSSKEKRKLHEEYYGKVFAYNNPPLIDKDLNITGLPRQIWNCKCHIRPVINRSFFENSRKIQNAKRNIFKKAWYTIQNSAQCHNNPWRYRRFGEGQEV